MADTFPTSKTTQPRTQPRTADQNAAAARCQLDRRLRYTVPRCWVSARLQRRLLRGGSSHTPHRCARCSCFLLNPHVQMVERGATIHIRSRGVCVNTRVAFLDVLSCRRRRRDNTPLFAQRVQTVSAQSVQRTCLLTPTKQADADGRDAGGLLH
jgi:hypothetical protein